MDAATSSLIRIGLVLAALSCAEAAATVHKCRAGDGRFTYQQMPCAESEQSVGADIPSQFPPPNLAERERILEREAEMYRRLEAQRDRLSAEAVARLSQPQVVVLPAEAHAGIPLYAMPRWKPRLAPRNAYRDWASGRLR